MRLHLLAGVLAISLAFLVQGPAAPVQSYGFICDAPDVVLDNEERLLLERINYYRRANGLATLEPVYSLTASAGWMAGDMAWRNYISHTDWFGRDAATRHLDCGNNAPFRGEIIAAGPAMETADAAMDAWLKSETHHEEMLKPHYRVAGVSRFYHPVSAYNWYWVVDFASE
jgi:uncharacterized protein YkwD